MLLCICYVNSNNKNVQCMLFYDPYYFYNGYIIWYTKTVLTVLIPYYL